jgi:Uma2 family endonuclease
LSPLDRWWVVIDPKLIIEVLSPSIKGYDKRDKFILYRTLASRREAVLMDAAAGGGTSARERMPDKIMS